MNEYGDYNEKLLIFNKIITQYYNYLSYKVAKKYGYILKNDLINEGILFFMRFHIKHFKLNYYKQNSKNYLISARNYFFKRFFIFFKNFYGEKFKQHYKILSIGKLNNLFYSEEKENDYKESNLVLNYISRNIYFNQGE
jgi:hypothetical protein